MLRRALPMLVLALLLAGGAVLLLNEASNDSPAPSPDSPLAQDFDYYLNGMVLDSFEPDGTLRYHLRSDRVTHFPDPDLSILESPSLLWFQPGEPHWLLTARTGELQPATPGETTLMLRGDVHARRSTDQGATLHIRSESLLLLPDAGEASTRDHVTLDGAGTQLQGAGMQAWLAENRIRLSKGSGRHE